MKYFASGQIDGYFNVDSEKLSEKFFRLMALYILSNLVSSVSWAISFGQEEVDVMLEQARDMLDYYDGMTKVEPSWYLRGFNGK